MMEMQITEYNQTASALALLREKYNGPFDVTTTKGMTVAKEARAEVRGYRVALEKLRVELKAPALERTRLIDAEAKRITAELLAIEEPIDRQIKAEEARKEEEKAAKARAEAARLASMAAKISAIRQRTSLTVGKNSQQIRALLEASQDMELSSEVFQEFLPDAEEALNETLYEIRSAMDHAILYEAEQARIQAEQAAEAARLKAEREELERLRAAETARQAEAARIAEETRKAEEARLQVEREAQAAALKAQREEQELQEREARQARKAEEARLQAERAAQEAELWAKRAEFEAQCKEQEREARQARHAEEMRLRAEREAMERQKAEFSARQREQLLMNDPLADLKQAVNADTQIAEALDEAYQRGYEAGRQKVGAHP